MATPIIKVHDYDTNGYFHVSDMKVKCVYVQCQDGTLRPVEFTQDGDLIEIKFQPAGPLFYRYKKKQVLG